VTRIRDEDIEEVRRRVNLVEVASDYMQVKRAGRLFKALCPFHNEKSPSLSLDPAKGLYHCFGCGEGGDAIRLVEKLENTSFVETIELLARRTGVELRYAESSPGDRAAHKRRLRLIDAHRQAAAFFHRFLMESAEAKAARQYLAGRGFSKETAERFQVGMAPPGWDALVAHLRAARFRDQELLDAGLASKRQDGGLIDRFRGRVTFPIFDVKGDPVAFGARLMEGGDGPKYLNSAESPVYHKASILYGLNWAKGPVVKQGRALLVEGYTDVIALHAAGIEYAVATCGTALGLEHLRGLQRFCQEAILSLDADEAGANAAERTYDNLVGDAQSLGMALKVVLMPQGDDPADHVARTGAEAFTALVDGAVPLLAFVLRREAARYNVGDPEVRARALASVIRLLAKTDKEVVRVEYARRVSDWIRVDPNIVYLELDKAVRSGRPPSTVGAPMLKRSSGQVRLEREAVKIGLQHPELIGEGAVDPDHFSVPTHRAIWTALRSGADPRNLGDALDEAGRRTLTELSLQPPEGVVDEALVEEVFRRLREFALTRRIDDLKPRLQALNPTTQPQEYDRMFTQLIELERDKRALSDPAYGEA